MPRFKEYESKGIKVAEKANPYWFKILAYIKVCPGCGEEFVSARPHTVTCSAKCRKRVSRQVKV